MECPNCGHRLNGEENCPNCGAKITYQAKENGTNKAKLLAGGCLGIGCIIPFAALVIIVIIILAFNH